MSSASPAGVEYKTVEIADLGFKAKANDRVLRFTVTTDALDRDHDVVIPSGMRFDEYLRNPQFLWAHKHDQLPIGKCVRLELARGNRALVGDFEFARHSFADQIFKLYNDGFLNAVSVGFRSLVSGPPSPEMLATRPELVKCFRVIKASNLFEVSAVPIPSNPEALRELTMKGLLSPEMHVQSAVRTEQDIVRAVAGEFRAAMPAAIDDLMVIAAEQFKQLLDNYRK